MEGRRLGVVEELLLDRQGGGDDWISRLKERHLACGVVFGKEKGGV